jgi:arsenite methyltransferase
MKRQPRRGSCCDENEAATWDKALYDAEQRGEPETAALAPLGCGNPTAVADLHEGETVLDLANVKGTLRGFDSRRLHFSCKPQGFEPAE